MRHALEFHDSEIRDVVADGATVRLRFSAASVRGEAGERGWLTSVQLTLGAAKWHGDTSNAFGRIAEAALRHGDHALSTLPIPGTLIGELELALRLANGTQFVLRCESLEASVDDDARFTLDMSC